LSRINAKYREVVIQTEKKGAFSEDDLALNDVESPIKGYDSISTSTVETFRAQLMRKRTLAEETLPSTQASVLSIHVVFGNTKIEPDALTFSPTKKKDIDDKFKSYFATKTHQEDDAEVNSLEKTHVSNIVLFDVFEAHPNRRRRSFKEEDANAKIFHPFACHVRNRFKDEIVCIL
jgi:hypothetical protein